MKKRVAAIAIGGLMAVSLFAGCGGGRVSSQNGVVIDETKTQIYVGNYYGGLGKEWLEKTAAKFEEAYASYQLNGKTGVQIVPENDKSKMDGNNLISNIASSDNQVFFTEKVNVNEYIDAGLMLDITDVVTSDLGSVAASEAGKTIESKVNANVKSYVSRNGAYYALPFYEGYYGFIYDVDLFNAKSLYFAEGYESETNLEDKFIVNSSATKSAGRDGIPGTTDDGLPITYQDFYDLCAYMKSASVTPMIYPGSYPHYMTRAAFNLWAANEGVEQMNINFTLSGTATTLVNVSGTTVSSVGDTAISTGNMAMLQKQAGKYHALSFLDELANHADWFSADAGASQHTDAQNRFILGSIDSEMEDIGIVVDGNWIESEASAIFAQGNTTKAARNIAIMPMPTASASVTKNTYVNTNNSFCFINANCDAALQPLAKEFLKFCHTEEALQIFHSTTGVPRPYSFAYDTSSALYAGLTTFQKSTYEVHNNSNFVFPYSGTVEFLSNAGKLGLNDSWGFLANVSGTQHENPFNVFKEYPSITAADYFNGLYTQHQ